MSKGGLPFEKLVEAFRRKVNSIPEECRNAVFYWLLFDRTQRSRIAFQNRLTQTQEAAKRTFWSEGIPPEIQEALVPVEEGSTFMAKLKSEEQKHLRKCKKEFEKTIWYNEVAVAAAEGDSMGPAIAGALLWRIGSVRRFPSFGKFVRYAGLDVTPDGKAPRKSKGNKVTYNPQLRATLFRLSEVWLRSKGVWRGRWDAWKAHYRARPDLAEENPGHIHNMARRKILREFLRNLYARWSEYEEAYGTGEEESDEVGIAA